MSALAKARVIGTILASGWTSIESLVYYRMMRRRTKIGLAEPLVANRCNDSICAEVVACLRSRSAPWFSSFC